MSSEENPGAAQSGKQESRDQAKGSWFRPPFRGGKATKEWLAKRSANGALRSFDNILKRKIWVSDDRAAVLFEIEQNAKVQVPDRPPPGAARPADGDQCTPSNGITTVAINFDEQQVDLLQAWLLGTSICVESHALELSDWRRLVALAQDDIPPRTPPESDLSAAESPVAGNREDPGGQAGAAASQQECTSQQAGLQPQDESVGAGRGDDLQGGTEMAGAHAASDDAPVGSPGLFGTRLWNRRPRRRTSEGAAVAAAVPGGHASEPSSGFDEPFNDTGSLSSPRVQSKWWGRPWALWQPQQRPDGASAEQGKPEGSEALLLQRRGPRVAILQVTETTLDEFWKCVVATQFLAGRTVIVCVCCESIDEQPNVHEQVEEFVQGSCPVFTSAEAVATFLLSHGEASVALQDAIHADVSVRTAKYARVNYVKHGLSRMPLAFIPFGVSAVNFIGLSRLVGRILSATGMMRDLGARGAGGMLAATSYAKITALDNLGDLYQFMASATIVADLLSSMSAGAGLLAAVETLSATDWMLLGSASIVTGAVAAIGAAMTRPAIVAGMTTLVSMLQAVWLRCPHLRRSRDSATMEPSALSDEQQRALDEAVKLEDACLGQPTSAVGGSAAPADGARAADRQAKQGAWPNSFQ